MSHILKFDFEGQEALQRGISIVAEAVKASFGPLFGLALISKRDTLAFHSDAISIVREIAFDNPFQDMGRKVLLEIAEKTAHGRNEGASLAIILAEVLFVESYKATKEGISPFDIKSGIEIAIHAVQKELDRQAVLISSPLESVECYTLDGGLLSPYFVTHPATMTAEIEQGHLLLFGSKLSNVDAFAKFLEQASTTKIVIAAEDFTPEVLTFAVLNVLEKKLPIALIKTSALQTLARLTGANIDSGENPCLGTFDRIVISREKTELFLTKANQARQKVLVEGVVAGGGVALLRAKDALKTQESKGAEAIGIKIVEKALSAPIRALIDVCNLDPIPILEEINQNSGAFGYNFEQRTFGDLIEMGIFDSVQTVKCALKEASSITSLLLTSKALIRRGPEAGF